MAAEGKPIRRVETPDADVSDEAATSSAGNGALLRRARDLLLAHGEPLLAADLASAVFGVSPGLVGGGPWLTLLEKMLRASPAFAHFDPVEDEPPARRRWGLAIWRQERSELANAEFVVVDVETTGLAPGFHRITEVAAVVVASGEQRAIFKSLVNPERRIPQFITKFTGITERMVARAPIAANVLPRLSAFIGDRPIVGHNIGFDLGFLSYEAERATLGTLFPADGIDTITLARRYLPTMRRASLDRVAAALHIPVRNRHRALADAQLTASVFALLLARAREAGCVTLEDLQHALHGGASHRRRTSIPNGMFLPRAQPPTAPQADTLDTLDTPDAPAVDVLGALADAQEGEATGAADTGEQPQRSAARRRASGSDVQQRPTGALYLNPAWRKDFSSSPGVYLMKDASGEVIYVGKAKCLRERLASYYNQPLGYTRKMDGLLQNVREIETRELGSELEALIVESRLIKQLQPRYNVQLRNHEQYPFIKVDLKSAYPRFYATREVSADGARYFGPFRSGGIVHATIELLYKVFPLRNCTRSLPPTGAPSEPCLRYHLKRCPAPCRGPLAEQATHDYHAAVREACAFLGGERADLIDRLKGEMFAASARQDYERAARLRDALRDVDQVLLGQRLVSGAIEANNLLIAYPSAVEGYCELFLIRHGRLTSQERIARDEAALMQAALAQVALAATLESPPPCVGREEVDQINIIARWIHHHSDDDTRAFFRLPDNLRDPHAQATIAEQVAHTLVSGE